MATAPSAAAKASVQAASIAAKKAAQTAAAQRLAARNTRQSAVAAANAQKLANQKTIAHTSYVNRHPNAVTITNGILNNPKTGLQANINDPNAVFNATYGAGDTSLNTPTTASVGTVTTGGSTDGTSDTGGILGLNGEQTAANVADTSAATPWYENKLYIGIAVLVVVAVVVVIRHKHHG